MTNLTLFQKTRSSHAHPRADGAKSARNEGENEKKIILIPIERITPNPAQPRRDFERDALLRLADSIRVHGILQPLAVRRAQGGGFELISGERRLRAAKMLGMYDVPCVVLDVDERTSAELAMIENVQREGLDMFEQSRAIASLIETCDLTQEQAARRLSFSQSYIANKLRILRLTEEERDLILSENLTERHARALLRIDDIEERKRALRHIAERRYNVAETEEYIDSLLRGEPAALAEKGARARQKIIIGDLGFFYNAIDHAVDLARRSGVDVTSERAENGEETVVTIKIRRGNPFC